jgi:hypothetical protein
MQLLTLELRAQLPALYAQEKNKDPIVICRFFCPWSDWMLFATEGFEQDEKFFFFGYIIGREEKWGHFALSEIEAIRGTGGLTVERDLQFKPGPFSEVIQFYRRPHGC